MSDDQVGNRRPGSSKPTRKKRTSGRGPKREPRAATPARDAEDDDFAPADSAPPRAAAPVFGDDDRQPPSLGRGAEKSDPEMERLEREEREARDADRTIRSEREQRGFGGRNERDHRGGGGHNRGGHRDNRDRDQRGGRNDRGGHHRGGRDDRDNRGNRGGPPREDRNQEMRGQQQPVQAPPAPHEDEAFENRGNQGVNPNRPPQGNQPKAPEGCEYSIQVTFDRQSRQFTAAVLEFPDLKISGPNRETAVRELEVKVDDKLLSLKESNQPIPEPIGAKRYPDTLSLRLSQAVFRKLDVLSRQERTELSELVNELLNGAIERRYEQLGGPRQQQQGGGGRQQHHHDRDNRGNREQGGGGGKHGNRGGRGGRMSQNNYQNTMSSRENFMEYVRNLEKGGGPGWKKR